MIGEKEIKTAHYCSPKANEGTVKSSANTCFSYDTLVLIARMFNAYQQDSSNHVPIVKNKRQLYNNLNQKLKPQCGDKQEQCWIEQPFMKSNSTKYKKVEELFRPKKPASWKANPRQWLNTYDILNVMEQYQEADKEFSFVGVFPIDFANKDTSGTCVAQEMCKLNLRDSWEKKKYKIGVVFNTDPSYKSGQHWICCFIGIHPRKRNFGIYYYDSVAMKPQKEIVQFMNLIKGELEELHPKHKDKIEFRVNKIRKQYKNWDCGVYAMLFIILMLKHKFDSIVKEMGNDDEVARFRDILYRP
jgi:hypothetical protein